MKGEVLSNVSVDKFDHEILRKLLTNWVASSDHTFLELENPWLQKAFQFANQEALLSMKTANTVKNDIKKNYEEHKLQRIEKLKVITYF